MIPSIGEREATLRDYVTVISKRKWLIIVFFIIIVTVVTIASFTATPTYRATALILIEREHPKITSFEDIYKLETAHEDYFQTQYKIIKSRSLTKVLFDELDLYSYPEYSRSNDPIGSFVSHILIEPIKNTRLVQVHFEGRDPEKITFLVNKLAETYIRKNVEDKIGATKYAVTWLTEQLNTLKKNVKESEEVLNKYITKHEIITISKIGEDRGSQTLMGELEKILSAKETQMAEYSKRYKVKHPKIIALKSEIDKLKKEIEEETKTKLEANKMAIQYHAIKREVDTNRQLYQALLKRVKEATVSEELKISNIKIVDQAEIPQRPIKPTKGLNIILASIIGLGLGSGIAFFIEYLDNTIKSAEDLELYVQLPFLGYIPSCQKEALDSRGIDLISHEKPKSIIAEAYRAIRTSIVFSATEDKPLKTLLLTSTIPQEGKTFVSINLSVVMAQANDKILLVDADMRKGRIHNTFNLNNDVGLSNYLVGTTDFENLIRESDVPNLKIVTMGAVPPNPSELLTSEKMVEFIKETTKHFDRVIIDSPPIMTVTDSTIIANLVDGVIEVVLSGKSPIEAVVRGKHKLIDTKAHIIGIILNSVKVGDREYYYYSSYYTYT